MTDRIDALVRPTVELFNLVPGITTTASCSGHAPGDEAYVAFVAASQEALFNLLVGLPRLGLRGGYLENRPWSASLALGCAAHDGRVIYRLSVSGTPFWAQRECLEEVESTLSAAILRQDARVLLAPDHIGTAVRASRRVVEEAGGLE